MLRSQFSKLWKKNARKQSDPDHDESGSMVAERSNSILFVDRDDSGLIPEMPEIPEDIVAVVTEFLRNDIRTLGSCSVVSSRWLRHARKELFSKIIVEDDRNTAKFHEFTRFVEGHPEIARSIKQLELSWQFANMLPEARPHVSRTMVESMVKHLPNLKAITFRGVQFTGNPPPLETSLPFAIDRMTCFNISSTTTLWVNILSLFTLKELQIHLDPNNDNRDIQDKDFYAPSCLSVQSLKLFSVETLSLQRVVGPALASNYLTSLEVALSRRGQVPAIGTLVEKSTATLQHIHLDLSSLRKEDSFVDSWKALNLSSCTALTSLSILMNLGAYTGMRFPVIRNVLSSNVNPRLRRIGITVNLHRSTSGSAADPAIARNISGTDCAQLEALIMGKYRALEDLVVDLRDMMNPHVLPQDVWNIVRESMPHVHSRGVLKVHSRFKRVEC